MLFAHPTYSASHVCQGLQISLLRRSDLSVRPLVQPRSSRRQPRQTQSPPSASGAHSEAPPSEEQPQTSKAKPKPKQGSSWTAKDAGRKDKDGDYLSNLGQAQEYNINVDHGQNIQNIDSIFVGTLLGHKSDIADGSLRDWEVRKFDFLVGDYYIAPSFLDAVVLHITKNFLVDEGAFGSNSRVPLILGIWGGKGQGKSFQCELAFKKLGVEAVIMSAGELEHEWAGTPARLIRERYRKAAELSKVRGKLSCLLINDIDAGLGHFENTQVTVNNQMVVGSLMNLCDDPNRVSTSQNWRENDVIRRVPIIVTGNDLSRIFAPLVRDGRMAKFYWQPSREDLVSILHQMYRDDGLSRDDMGCLIDTFGSQPLDFFGALRASLYDQQILGWIQQDIIKGQLSDEDANMAELSRRLVNREDLPSFEALPITLEGLLEQGRRLAREQDLVNSHKLSKEYLKDTGNAGGSLIGLTG